MTKNELVEIVQKTGQTKKVAEEIVNAVFDAIVDSLKKGEVVDISKFGKFSVSKRDARNGVNPQTGEKIKIAASKSVKFKVSKTVKTAVNV